MSDVALARRDTSLDWLVLLVAAVVIGASMAFTATEEWVYAFGWQIPEVCTVRKVLGFRCPGCGLTRSFVFMGHGAWWTAFKMNWLGPVLWLALAAQVPLRIGSLTRTLR